MNMNLKIIIACLLVTSVSVGVAQKEQPEEESGKTAAEKRGDKRKARAVPHTSEVQA